MPQVQPTQNETYLCTGFHVASSKHQYIVAFRPNATKHVAHHILIYGCESPGYREWDTPRAVWDCGEMATSHSMFHKGPTCRTGSQIIYAWAMDAPALKLPEGVGFKIGGNSGINYLVLQVTEPARLQPAGPGAREQPLHFLHWKEGYDDVFELRCLVAIPPLQYSFHSDSSRRSESREDFLFTAVEKRSPVHQLGLPQTSVHHCHQRLPASLIDLQQPQQLA
ncbi:peptidylglycine alpha-hydroxylating monooxygenase [Ixodes scapularis]